MENPFAFVKETMKKLGPEVGHLRDLPNETVEKVFYYNNIIVDMQ